MGAVQCSGVRVRDAADHMAILARPVKEILHMHSVFTEVSHPMLYFSR